MSTKLVKELIREFNLALGSLLLIASLIIYGNRKGAAWLCFVTALVYIWSAIWGITFASYPDESGK